MKIHYLQHEPFKTPGAILTWAKEHGHSLSSTMLYEKGPLPSLSSFDMLVIMGGSMSVYEKHLYAWMGLELTFIESAIKAGKTVLGICLGAQLIAASLGAAVYKNTDKEIGWFPVSLTPEGTASGFFKKWPEAFKMFQWHGDTFDVPAGGGSDGLQQGLREPGFHLRRKNSRAAVPPETTARYLDLFLSNCQNDCASEGPYIQTADQIREQCSLIPAMNGLLFKLLDGLEKIVRY